MMKFYQLNAGGMTVKHLTDRPPSPPVADAWVPIETARHPALHRAHLGYPAPTDPERLRGIPVVRILSPLFVLG